MLTQWSNGVNIGDKPIIPVNGAFGWECPRCGQVWAPHIDRCQNCRPRTYTTTGTFLAADGANTNLSGLKISWPPEQPGTPDEKP
jgi:predicted RNA-binding Zn-ribbon protein involved in translation (DUF1610 family)